MVEKWNLHSAGIMFYAGALVLKNLRKDTKGLPELWLVSKRPPSFN
jgi:hypothetical protein